MYTEIKGRLQKDYSAFEERISRLIKKYGSDYNKFVKDVMWTEVKLFTRIWKKKSTGHFLNNTFVDALCLYLFVREMIDTKKGDLLIYEFSPFHGWTTYLMLRAICDSGEEDRIQLKSCELNRQCYKSSLKSLRGLSSISFKPLEMRNGDAVAYTKEFDDNSIDLLFIDSDHSSSFAKKYLEAKLFQKAKKEAYIHIHDFVFWDNCPEKYQEPEVVSEYILAYPDRFSHYVFGQLFYLLGGTNAKEELMQARTGNKNYFGSKNYFVRNNLPEYYWLGGTINGVNKRGIHRNKTWVSGLALWMVP